jgi:hypothetical protein
MAIIFPNSPTNGQTETISGKVWKYNATKNSWSPAPVEKEVVVGGSIPTIVGEFIWFQTDGSGNLIDILVGKNP